SGAGSLDEARKTFEGRLLALAGTYRQLTNTNWSGVSLSEIVHLTLEPFAARTDIDGPDLLLSAKNAQSFSLALHELATNALKHGALSCAGGNVSIAWSIASNGGGPVLKFRWRELGGPPRAWSRSARIRHFATGINLQDSQSRLCAGWPDLRNRRAA